MKDVLILLGPNLNLTGIREKSIYGEESAESIQHQIMDFGKSLNFNCTIFQTNYEGEMIDKIHGAKDNFDGIVINPGALTHYSYALRDAVLAVRLPFIETHMSNIFSREEFRRKSVISDVCAGLIVGFGKHSYFLALQALKELM